jgi:hypothetical protein
MMRSLIYERDSKAYYIAQHDHLTKDAIPQLSSFDDNGNNHKKCVICPQVDIMAIRPSTKDDHIPILACVPKKHMTMLHSNLNKV